MSAGRRLDIASPDAVPADAADAIGVASALSPAQVIEVVHGSSLRHVVQSDGLRFEAECRAAEKMIHDPRYFLQNPLETIFGPAFKALKPFHTAVDAAAKKAAPLAELSKYIAGLDESESVSDGASMVADELYTNASKNAWPADRGLFQGPAAHPGGIELFAAADQEVLAIGCRDSFGLLDLRTLIERIKTCYEQGIANAIRWGDGGAGIGSFMVFDACVSYYAAVDPGRTTMVCIVLPLSRRTGETPKNIHLLALPKAGSRG